jgi:hypothetical protein
MSTKKKREFRPLAPPSAFELIMGSNVISVNVEITKALGCPIASIVFAQFLFYQNGCPETLREAYIDETGFAQSCFVKSDKDICEDTGLSLEMLESAKDLLRSCGVLVELEIFSKGIFCFVSMDTIIDMVEEKNIIH